MLTFALLAEQPKGAKGAKKGKPVNKDRFISKMFLRGDGVILVLKNPLAAATVPAKAGEVRMLAASVFSQGLIAGQHEAGESDVKKAKSKN